MDDSHTVHASKKMQYAKLRDELSKLEKNTQDLNNTIAETVSQVPAFRKMGTLHASVLMSVNSVLNKPKSNTSTNN